jgi:dTDP-glucose 4,6-dehydratase
MERDELRPILITGGAGFIGTNLVRLLLEEQAGSLIDLDALTYAGDRGPVSLLGRSRRHRFVHGDIRDRRLVRALLAEARPRAVLHLAAETHVDRSIEDPSCFVSSNVEGTCALLEEVRRYWAALEGEERARFRFLAVSTDEVYGSLGASGRFSEETRYDPSSPYSASKAAADHLVRAYGRTYGLPVLITHGSNTYGPHQHPEKLIPLMITRALAGEPLPVYGTGENVREWLHVSDHCRGLLRVLEAGTPGRSYNIGGGDELRNLEVVQAICDVLDARGVRRGGSCRELIRFVEDRRGHDYRYALDASRARDELGWTPRASFASAIAETVDWYLDRARRPAITISPPRDGALAFAAQWG